MVDSKDETTQRRDRLRNGGATGCQSARRKTPGYEGSLCEGEVVTQEGKIRTDNPEEKGPKDKRVSTTRCENVNSVRAQNKMDGWRAGAFRETGHEHGAAQGH